MENYKIIIRKLIIILVYCYFKEFYLLFIRILNYKMKIYKVLKYINL